ncbi:hypothetical protein FrEUN1fDRAFT_7826 [Parafrankia sp. EUN1f]|nr:hypothetical protein FrEUN1fDRAFT_7826 [Parafrankia sp. EUN1f]
MPFGSVALAVTRTPPDGKLNGSDAARIPGRTEGMWTRSARVARHPVFADEVGSGSRGIAEPAGRCARHAQVRHYARCPRAAAAARGVLPGPARPNPPTHQASPTQARHIRPRPLTGQEWTALKRRRRLQCRPQPGTNRQRAPGHGGSAPRAPALESAIRPAAPSDPWARPRNLLASRQLRRDSGPPGPEATGLGPRAKGESLPGITQPPERARPHGGPRLRRRIRHPPQKPDGISPPHRPSGVGRASESCCQRADTTPTRLYSRSTGGLGSRRAETARKRSTQCGEQHSRPFQRIDSEHSWA